MKTVNFSKVEIFEPLINAIKAEFPQFPIFTIPYIGSPKGFSECIRVSKIKYSADVWVYPEIDYPLDLIIQSLHLSLKKKKPITLNEDGTIRTN